MQTFRVREKTDKDGTLRLNVPLGKPDAEFEIVLVLQPQEAAAKPERLNELGWPPGYFEATFGSIKDETFMRHPQGELPKPVDLN